MLEKKKYYILAGALIVLTIIGYFSLPKNEIYLTNEKEISGEYLENTKEELIYVHIEGAIENPGVKEVKKGTRIFELIEISGGALDEADLSRINLANVLKDEQKIMIPYKIEELEQKEIVSNSKVSKNEINTYSNSKLVNINYSNLEELMTLSGIGKTMAQRIIDYRDENGLFNSIEDIKSVSGIGEAKFNKIKDNITI